MHVLGLVTRMTESEIKEWLGLRPDFPRRLRPEIVEGMADVPRPPDGPTNEHLAVFTAFLACVPGHPSRMGNLFESRTVDCDHKPGKGCYRCCDRCNLDQHHCPGCGANLEHGQITCSDCARSYVQRT